MPATDWDEETFETIRPLLFSIAYRLLGTATEAEDVVRDAWCRTRQGHRADIRSPPAYLTMMVTRLCIDRLRSPARMQIESPGTLPPERLGQLDPPSAALASSLTIAFLVVLKHLAPTERAVFLLREVFELDVEQIATSVGITEANTRQILTRARGRLRESHPRVAGSRVESEEQTH